MIIDILFLVNSMLAVTLAVLMVIQKNPIYSALCLIGVFFPLAFIFLLLWAPFVAVIQILVYAGAIMVLFVFVIMMINLEHHELEVEKHRIFQIIVGAGSGLLTLTCVYIISKTVGQLPAERPDALIRPDFGSTHSIGRLIFEKYMVQFELVAVLILVALIGAVFLGKKKLD